ncbi:hypothetical protein B9Z55_016085 [Caenorhabditis nigoni]|uniref:Cadherin domain-containing protein n=1 Tax=Caenorhabditis nigoni TaxID=1611254 RepID=A0A2G5UD57_9PELO|nr:hypothetical protein B9Z55_016085 [Caenorhabditis nigoni]
MLTIKKLLTTRLLSIRPPDLTATTSTHFHFYLINLQATIFQLIVVNSAASGRYTLQISLEDSEDVSSSPSQTVDVFVENSQSHAHFRKPKYSLEIDANTIENGVKLTQVELEGVPIDEAKIMILDGNPGWVTVEEYGGKVNVGKYDG